MRIDWKGGSLQILECEEATDGQKATSIIKTIFHKLFNWIYIEA